MTTPSNDNGWPVAESNIGGAGGTLMAGTNNLQSSLDTLTTAVSNLTAKIGTLSLGGQGAQGQASQAQSSATTQPLFPRPYNPFSNPGTQAGGIGGGGPGGTANISQPTPFGMGGTFGAGLTAVAGAFAGYGQQQLPIQLGLNAYATQTAMAQGQTGNNFTAQYRQAFGYNNQNLNFMASSPMDALQFAQIMQQVGAAPNYMSTSIGRAGFGAAAAFSTANPLASAAQSGSFAQQLFSPAMSLNMLSMGYVTPRMLGGGNARNMGQIIQGMMSNLWGGRRPTNQQLYAGLSPGGNAYNSLVYGLGFTGSQVTQALPVFTEYNDLFNKGYTPASAQALINASKSGNLATAKAAQATLSSLGIKTATSSAQSLRNNQAVLTGRDADIASGFAAALQTSTGLLAQFNADLSDIMTRLHLNGITGGLGGLLGTFAGTNGGNSLLGMAGSVTMGTALLKILGLRGAGSAAGAAASGTEGGELAAGATGLGGASGGLAALGPFGIGAGVGLGANWLGNRVTRGTPAIQAAGSAAGAVNGQPGLDQIGAWLMYHLFGGSATATNTTATQARIGGGAAPVSIQQSTNKSPSVGYSPSGSAISAVNAARSQLGVPYVYGDEDPGVGFDCSGLTQWSYGQAGVKIPRTAAEQWAALSRKAVPLSQVQEGDLVFMAGADGSLLSPGHVGMMINNHQLIQAPYTGADVQIIGYDPRAWQHAARPTGKGGAALTGNAGVGLGAGIMKGDTGMGMSGTYGSVNEIDAISSALGGLGGGMVGISGGANYGSAGSGSGTRGAGGSTMTGGGNVALAKRLAAARGWAGVQWTDLDKLWTKESNFSNTAMNPGSGAYGIAQALPASKYPLAGRPPSMGGSSSATAQIEWGLQYIAQRYRNPAGAWAHETAFNWYAGGGILGNGLSIVGERGPELMLGGQGNQILDNNQTMAILKAVQAQPQAAQTPWMAMNNQPSATSSQMQQSVALHFNQGSITINMPNTGTDSAAKSGREIARQFTKYLQHEDLYDAISKGKKNG